MNAKDIAVELRVAFNTQQFNKPTYVNDHEEQIRQYVNGFKNFFSFYKEYVDSYENVFVVDNPRDYILKEHTVEKSVINLINIFEKN